MLGDNGGKNTAADEKTGGQPHEARRGSRNQIIEYAIGHRFMKCTLIAVRPDIQFEAFQLYTLVIGDVIEKQRCEIGLPGFRAKAGEFRDLHLNQKIPRRMRIIENLKGGSR